MNIGGGRVGLERSLENNNFIQYKSIFVGTY